MPRSGSYAKRVQVDGPTASVPLPDGGWTEGYAPLTPPDWDCSIEPATARSLESLGAGTVLATATHELRGAYHPELTTKCRVRVVVSGVTHTMNVLFVGNPQYENSRTVLVCAEVVD